ncbi:hypothetical protein D3C83_60310 [compost metagenome]
MPAAQKNSASSLPSGAPPEIAYSKRLPRRARIFEKTSLSARRTRQPGSWKASRCGSARWPAASAQSNSAFLTPPVAATFSSTFARTFS